MNYESICRELIKLGFDGDLQAASDEAKDRAVCLYLSSLAPHELYEYFPAEINHPKHLLELIYHDELWACHCWSVQAMAAQSTMGSDWSDDMGYWSEALDGYDNLKAIRSGDGIHFCRLIKEAFYLYSEHKLQAELEQAYKSIIASEVYDNSIDRSFEDYRDRLRDAS